jgi:hypothetical protein
MSQIVGMDEETSPLGQPFSHEALAASQAAGQPYF